MATTPIEVGREYAGWDWRVCVTDIWKPEGARGGTPRTHYITYRLVDGGDLPSYLPGGYHLGAQDERRCTATEFRREFRPALREAK